ncbi:MAG: hypothetical protein JW744_04140, partial [Candidatus Diapherotrites archaeon]|nr:hypothetical protein [Candidatus Diapherotrites archaeon]
FGESALYVMFFWSGIIGSVVQQTLIIPDLQDCVDDQEGYYLHMFAPTRAPEENTSPNQQASEKAGDIIKNVTDFVTGKSGQAEQGQSKSFYEQAKDQIALKAKELSDKAKTSTILQASVETMGQTDGILFFEELFFFWFKGRAQAAAYDKETKTFYRDTRNDINLLVDNEAGKISIASPGKPMEDVITSPDHVRLANPSSDNASLEIPQRIGQVELPNAGPNANAEMFSLDTQGNLTVHPIVLDCIKRNVEQQTGVPLLTNKVTDAFGAVEAIVTTSHPRIEYNIAERSITATGTPREIVYGASARAVVYVNRKTVLSNSHDLNVGLFQSIQFENGIIVYKPETNELLIWLRYHKDSILEQGDAAGLKATPTTYVNPETLCPEPAIDLEAIPNLEAGQASIITERVDNFNAAMEKMGPFQMFDTEKHRFIFYSIKKTPDCNPSAPDCCENRVKIIDKETGEVIDEPMIGNIEKTPTGVKFTTMGEDGQPNQHTLDFSAENGIPKVSYNGMPAETLLSARGPNGSFWYDPETGRWYPENAQLIPLSEAFRQGFDARHRDDCSVSTTGGGNSMSVQFGAAADMPFNLPSLPEQPVAMLLFVVSMLAVIVASRVEIEKRLRR